MANSPSRTSRTRFTPALVVGDDPARRDAAAARFREPLGGAESAAPGAVEAALRSPGGVGAIVFVPSGGEDDIESVARLVETCRALDRGLPVMLVADGLSPQDVVLALRHGVADVLFFDVPDDEGMRRVVELAARRHARARGILFPQDRAGVPRLLGTSVGMREVARLVERVAGSDSTVLILGESGTGKELVAQALHAFSPRARGPFIAINCAAIPETLLENELFGHEKGSYTGASSTAMGKVEAAEKGTLFLDEIGEMPLPLQSKILRLLQERTYDRIGGTKTRKADVRIVAATNRELKEEVGAKRFREDLYYRLSVVPIPLPALRERPEDIPVIASAILERLARDLERPGLHFSPQAMERLISYRWPGNVRELENELERAVVLAGHDELGPGDLELRSRVDDPDRAALARLAPIETSLEGTLAGVARSAARIRITLALEEARGDRAVAARALAIDLEELERRLAE